MSDTIDLKNSVSNGIRAGRYQMHAKITAGTLQLQSSSDDTNFFNIDDASWSADQTTILEFGNGFVKPVVTGTVVVTLDKIQP